MQFDVPLLDLECELTDLLAQIPRGRVTTYGDLADALGLRAAARWVGEFLRSHPHPEECPCHRVVRKGGELGLYVEGREPAEKSDRLRSEGVPVRDGRIEGFDEFVFRDFRSTKPLARLIELQQELAQRVQLVPRRDVPRLAAGFDVSYSRDGMATGACAVVESGSGRVVWSTTYRDRPRLPYIPSLLTFRELPMLLALFERSHREFPQLDLYFVDGNGILHPRGAGVAACFGVVADVPTIGVAKSLLCGRLQEPAGDAPDFSALLTVNDRVVGAVLIAPSSVRPLYVSPGQKVDVASAARLARAFAFGHRLPEPLYWADRLSRAESRLARK
ncbi:MAG TPA: endonuclease V [Planctomycetaceae bacterium]|nr:endonuclease V [Planctomycetaceae bacterium]